LSCFQATSGEVPKRTRIGTVGVSVVFGPAATGRPKRGPSGDEPQQGVAGFAGANPISALDRLLGENFNRGLPEFKGSEAQAQKILDARAKREGLAPGAAAGPGGERHFEATAPLFQGGIVEFMSHLQAGSFGKGTDYSQATAANTKNANTELATANGHLKTIVDLLPKVGRAV
jgi:hypothetical protein